MPEKFRPAFKEERQVCVRAGAAPPGFFARPLNSVQYLNSGCFLNAVQEKNGIQEVNTVQKMNARLA